MATAVAHGLPFLTGDPEILDADGLGCGLEDPRRTGASVKTVQKVMGHASATLTLDLYAHLFADDLDALAAGVEALGTPPPAPVVELRSPA